MGDGAAWYDELTMPALLRAARRTYGSAIRRALAEAGYDDVPTNGSYVISGIARTRAQLAEIITALGVSTQAAGHLVDTLTLRGYLERAIDPDDRRRLTVSLTERGLAAALVIRSAADRIDADLVGRVGPEFVAQARATLAALVEAQDDTHPESGPPDR
jgi:DNA-binding MarR family transcriptional regulator